MRVRPDLATDLRRARDVMDREYADDGLTLDRVARVALMSRSHFVRQFARQFGTTPAAYLSRRLARPRPERR